MQWKLHAFSLQPDQYHLALETPRGNLVAGVHWLQSAFGNRFSRTRGASARAFRGRYQAIMVEPGPMWANVVDYIHLGPVLSKVVTFDHLAVFRWSSYRFFLRPDVQPRPPFLVCSTWLQAMGLADTPAGWASYTQRLEELRADSVRVKATFGSFGRGWAYGSPEFRRALAEKLVSHRSGETPGPTMAEDNRRDWHVQLDTGLKQLRRDLSEAPGSPKSAPWKIALAAWLKSNTSVLNRWLSEQLHMGPPDAVSRYVGELRLGKRPAAAEEYSMLGGSESETAE